MSFLELIYISVAYIPQTETGRGVGGKFRRHAYGWLSQMLPDSFAK